MKTALPVSIIVVSRARPDALKLCLTGISQLQYPNFEVVVVADPAGLDAARTLSFFDQLKCIPFDEANIAQARNVGIEAAQGEVVAFVDDDAVPEPSWLTYLTVPFEQSDVSGAGGYVRGRNGISYQWCAQCLDENGQTTALEVDGAAPFVVPSGIKGHAVKTEGTNMAFRRGVLLQLGGFDPAFRYFHDDSDLNMRMAEKGLKVAIVPNAQVHHGFAPNETRKINRAPKNLSEIGASWAVFLKKHGAKTEQETVVGWVRAAQRSRAIRHMVSGQLEPSDVPELMHQFDTGYAKGLLRPISGLPPLADRKTGFHAFRSSQNGEHKVIAGRILNVANLQRRARECANEGCLVTLMVMSRTCIRHRVYFHPDGYWLQRGGLYGKSERSDRWFRFWNFPRRIERESQRISALRMANSTFSSRN